MTIILPRMDFYHPYTSQGRVAVCHVRVLQSNNHPVLIILSELRNNPGPSVTNGAADLVADLMKQLHRKRLLRSGADPILWVEHYNDQAVYGQGFRDCFSKIQIEPAGAVTFRHIPLDQLAQETGYAPEQILVASHSLELVLSDQQEVVGQ